MKRFVFILLFSIFVFSISFASVPSVNSEQKIYDYADLFSNEEEITLFNKADDFIKESDLDIAIVTIDTNPLGNAQDYADDFYDYNNFGTGATHDGLLLLLDMDTREIYISTEGQAILIYDDERINLILDEIYNYITKDNYKAAEAFINMASKYFKLGIPESNTDYVITDEGEYEYLDPVEREQPSFLSYLNPLSGKHNYLLVGGASFIFCLLFILRVNSSQKTVMAATSAENYVKNENWNVKDDVLIKQNVVRRYNPPPETYSSGSSRGFSSHGGSSTHHSSSGRTHGGGGRHF